MINLRSSVIKNACRQWTMYRPLERHCHSERRDTPQTQLDGRELGRQCQQLCTDYHLKLVFCADAGSRAWGYHSDDSDYDVKGFYAINSKNYLKSIVDPRHNAVDSFTHSFGKVEIELWDIGKVLSQYYGKANQTPLLWLHSDLVYYQTHAGKRLKKFLFSKNEHIYNAIINNYVGLAYSNYRYYVKEKKLKRYINVWRAIMYALSTIAHKKIAPSNVNVLLTDERVTEMIPVEHVRNALRLRIEGVEHFECDAATIQLVEDKLEYIKKYSERPDPKFRFDAEWKSIVEELLLTQPPEIFSEIQCDERLGQTFVE